MEAASVFFRTNSYGRFWTRGTVTPLLQLPSPKAIYFPTDANGKQFWEPARILSDAREAAREAGFDPAEYELEMVRFNSPFIQSFANIGSRGAWMVSSHPATTIHELGHNLGLPHSNAWSGSANGSGMNVEYGDHYDIMGNPWAYELAGFHFLNKRALGWLSDSNAISVNGSGVFRVYAHDIAKAEPGRVYALRVRKDDERDYWIEKRVRFDDDLDEMARSGLLTYWNAWPESNGGTQIVDTAGNGQSLPPGLAFVDAEARLKIIPLELSSDHAFMDVAVLFGSTPNRLTAMAGWVHYAGDPNTEYIFQSSIDLRHWNDFARRSSSSGEVFASVAGNSGSSFYRVVKAPSLR